MLEKFAHVFPAMVTPMKEDGSFNYEVAKKHADWMMDNGIGGIGVLMAAGEYQSMSLEEHMEYVNGSVCKETRSICDRWMFKRKSRRCLCINE